jgi:hypothetical protein
MQEPEKRPLAADILRRLEAASLVCTDKQRQFMNSIHLGLDVEPFKVTPRSNLSRESCPT